MLRKAYALFGLAGCLLVLASCEKPKNPGSPAFSVAEIVEFKRRAADGDLRAALAIDGYLSFEGNDQEIALWDRRLALLGLRRRYLDNQAAMAHAAATKLKPYDPDRLVLLCDAKMMLELSQSISEKPDPGIANLILVHTAEIAETKKQIEEKYGPLNPNFETRLRGYEKHIATLRENERL
jgi:hypothetical protein